MNLTGPYGTIDCYLCGKPAQMEACDRHVCGRCAVDHCGMTFSQVKEALTRLLGRGLPY